MYKMLAFSDVYGNDFHVPGWLAFTHITDFILAELDMCPLPSTGENVSCWLST